MKPKLTAIALAATAALVALGGCQSGKRESSSDGRGAAATGEHGRSSQAEGVTAQSDADRAEETLERQKQQDSAQRRPYSPPPARPVDQPRTPPPGRP